MSNLEAALELAAGGEPVLPLHTPTFDAERPCSCNRIDCKNVGKHPRTLHGKDDATTDIETITRWFSMWPTANVGRRPLPGEVVLDIDPRNGGDAQLRAIVARFGDLPATRSAVTGSGGQHISFRHDGPVKGQLAPGIDLKTSTGYLVAPPSLHASGRRYEWDGTGAIAPMPMALVPYILPSVLPTAGRRSSTGATPNREAGLLRIVTEAEEGERNRRLYWACRRAAEHGIDPNSLVEAAVAGGLSRREAERSCASAFKATEVDAP